MKYKPNDIFGSAAVFTPSLSFLCSMADGSADDGGGGTDDDGKGGDKKPDAEPTLDEQLAALEKTGDEKTGDEKTGDEKTGDEKTGDEKTGDIDLSKVPEHLRGKTDQETLDKVAEAYKGMRQKLSKGDDNKAPEKSEDYELSLGDAFKDVVDFKSEDDGKILAMMQGLAHEQGMSQEAFQNIFGGLFTKLQEGGLIPSAPDYASMIENLGGKDVANQLIGTVEGWGDSLVDKDIFTEEMGAEFKIMAGTEAGLRVLNTLREMQGGKDFTTNINSGDGAETPSQLQARLDDPRYGKDEDFTKETEAAYARAHPG